MNIFALDELSINVSPKGEKYARDEIGALCRKK
jgi:hypothetical protein